jgi:hypothetical protein
MDLLVDLSTLVIFYTICWAEPGAQNFPAYLFLVASVQGRSHRGARTPQLLYQPAYSAHFYGAYPALNQAKISIIRFNMFTIVRESLGTLEPPFLSSPFYSICWAKKAQASL